MRRLIRRLLHNTVHEHSYDRGWTIKTEDEPAKTYCRCGHVITLDEYWDRHNVWMDQPREEEVISRNGELSASEALYGFGGWLTSSDKVLTISAKHDAGIVAELVGRFCEANGLEEPREGWEKRFVFPEHIR